MDHLELYADMCHEEQMLRSKSTLPTVEDYWRYRLGSSAIYVLITLNE